MTDTETRRYEQQRRESDAWLAIKQAEAQHRNMTIGVMGSITSLVLGGAWWLSIQAARTEVNPVTKDVAVLKMQRAEDVKRNDRMESKIDRLIDMIGELKKR